MTDPLPPDPRGGPIHLFFGLSYASYLVLPRTLLQSMPIVWQEQFTALLETFNERFYTLNLAPSYTVQPRDLHGKIRAEPFPHYRHAPLIAPRAEETA